MIPKAMRPIGSRAGARSRSHASFSTATSAVILAALTCTGARAQTNVVLATELGDIAIAVYDERAPISSSSFLALVDAGYYEGAEFYRVVTAENDRGSPPIEVIQGGVFDAEQPFQPVEHESTRETGILHEDGVISLARDEPGTANGAAFFICIGDQPALDYGGMRNPDGLGFAAFGRVVEGMDVVHAIHRMEANGPSETAYTEGQMLTEFVKIVSAYRQTQPGNQRD